MSGYGGQNWQDPYQGGWSNPYGGQGWQDPYGAPGPGYGPPVQPASNGPAIGALVCNIITTLLCCLGFSIAGIVTSAIALSRLETDPESARNLTKWSWGLFIVNIALAIIGIIIYVAVIAAAGSSGVDYGGSTYD